MSIISSGRITMKRRPFDSRKYILSALIVSLIFILGITLGLIIENKRVEYITNFYEQEKSDFESLQLQYDLLTMDTASNKSCYGLSYLFNEYLKRLDKKGDELEAYTRDSSRINKERFDLLLRQYLIEEFRSWMLAKKLKGTCNKTDMVLILNFHARDCPKCDDTGILLSYFKKKFKEDILIFSFDADFKEEPLISTLKQLYNITKYPTLIINNKKYDEPLNKEQLQNVLCSYYNQSNNQELVEKCKS